MLMCIFGLCLVLIGKLLFDLVLFVVNYILWIDIELLYSQCVVCFVVKVEIVCWLLVGWMVVIGGIIFYCCGFNYLLVLVMVVMVECLCSGCLVVVFLEGGSGYNGVLKVFYVCIFQVVFDVNVLVQLVVLCFVCYGCCVIDVGFCEYESFMVNFLCLFGSVLLDVEVYFFDLVLFIFDVC